MVVPIGENDCLLLGGQWFSEATDCTHNVEPVIETTEEESQPNRRKSLPQVGGRLGLGGQPCEREGGTVATGAFQGGAFPE